MNITTSSIDYENGRTYFHLENLFNGDKLLGNRNNIFVIIHFIWIRKSEQRFTN